MSKCVECLAEISAGSRFCNECGAAQPEEVGDASIATVEEAGQSTGPAVDPMTSPPLAAAKTSLLRSRRTMLLGLVALILISAAGLGINARVQADKAAAAAELAAAEAAAEEEAALQGARAEALGALSAVERCESAVEVGVTLNDLSEMAKDAREEVRAFGRSDSARLLPGFTKALVKASDAYMDSCSEWFDSNESAMDAYDIARDEWIDTGKGAMPDLDDFKDDSKYQACWSDAGYALDDARVTLNTETTTQ